MQARRGDFLALIKGSEQLDEGLRAKNVTYIEEFFQILDDPELTNEEIVRRCRGVDLMNKHFDPEPTGSTSAP